VTATPAGGRADGEVDGHAVLGDACTLHGIAARVDHRALDDPLAAELDAGNLHGFVRRRARRW